MNHPKHHLDDATLLAYSSGGLRMPLSVVAAVHVGLCSTCRARLDQADELGGTLMQQQDPAAWSPHLREAMLARLDAEPATMSGKTGEMPDRPRHAGTDCLPPELHGYFGSTYSGLKWKRLAPGLQRIRADAPGGGSLMLLRIAPGKSMPVHSHRGSEITVVLKGAYRDELGHFGPGDVADLDDAVQHRPVTEAGESCVCLAALDAPLRFPGRLARMLQPLFGF